MHHDDISWIADLRLLRFLDMSGVNLSSTRNWVRVMTLLPNLKVLKLSYCGLSLPREPKGSSNLSSLETLDLTFNSLETLNPAYWFWDARTMKELDLAFTDITGPFPVAIGNMTSLEMLSLGGNDLSLSGGIKYELFDGLCNLRFLNLWSNEINQDMAEFMNRLPACTKSTLQSLDLSATNLSGPIPNWIDEWRNLSDLLVSDNRLLGSNTSGNWYAG